MPSLSDPPASEPQEDIFSWFMLKTVPGIGNLLFKRLIDRFKTPDRVFDARDAELLQVEGIFPRLVSAIRGQKLTDAARMEVDLAGQRGYTILTLNDPDYPGLLLRIPDPPPLLYVYGDIGPCTWNIAVVGSRNPTRYGVMTTRRLCGELAGLKITIVSGMARGIDTVAHLGALETGGRTIAVLGSGLERIYPVENIRLFHRIAESGAVISEYPLMTEPEAHHFPARNRIISGISLGTVVVEAARKSGSLITARLAAEQNREVFAVPGNINSFRSEGTHSLIKQGAKLVENVQDILDEIPHVMKTQMADTPRLQEKLLGDIPPLSPEETRVFKALSPYPIHIDELVRKVNMDAGHLSAILLQLELKGIVGQSPGKMFTMEIENVLGVGGRALA